MATRIRSLVMVAGVERQMNKKWLLRIALVLAFLVVLLLAAAYDPTHIVPGLLRNEEFFRGYPTSYWREVLRADGEAGEISRATFRRLDNPRAVPVLLLCVEDPDPNVRWPTVFLLEWAGEGSEVEPVIRRALDDEDLSVRYQAIRALAQMQVVAKRAVPRLIELSRDDDPQISAAAMYAIWSIDPATASGTGDWQEFTSEEWGFSVTMPGPPTQSDNIVDSPHGPVPRHLFGANYGLGYWFVAVTEYAPEVLEDDSLQDLLKSSAEETAATLGGTLVRCDPVEYDGRLGCEQLINVAGMELSLSRVFPVGDRSYQIGIAVPCGSGPSHNAREHFFRSLQVTYSPEAAGDEADGQEEL